jgi:alpha-glucosidase
MQWDASKNAGFSPATKTWLPVPPSATYYNVASEQRNPDSILNFYKHVIALRRSVPALRKGSYVAVNRDDQNVLAYLRKGPDGTNSVLVALNMSAQPQVVNFELQGFGVLGKSLHPLLAAPQRESTELSLKEVKLPPFAVLIAEVK